MTITNPYIDINTPNLRQPVQNLLKMQRISGVVRVDGLDIDANGEFTTMRIYFVDNATMQHYIDGVSRMRAQGQP